MAAMTDDNATAYIEAILKDLSSLHVKLQLCQIMSCICTAVECSYLYLKHATQPYTIQHNRRNLNIDAAMCIYSVQLQHPPAWLT